jgi:hypothetical protein
MDFSKVIDLHLPQGYALVMLWLLLLFTQRRLFEMH